MKKHSFTLVELLAVIGIIVILAGLIFAGVGMARSSAKATQCQHNQEQTMKLVAQAMSSNKDFLVSGNDFSASPGTTAAWTRYLYGGNLSADIQGRNSYISDMEALRCPTFQYTGDNRALGALATDADRATAMSQAFGMVYRTSVGTGDRFAGFDFRGTRFLRVGTGASAFSISPNQLLLGGCAVNNAAPYKTANALLYSGTWNSRLVRTHSDRCNVFFLDGHVEGLIEAELNRKYLPSSSSNAPVQFSGGWVDPES